MRRDSLVDGHKPSCGAENRFPSFYILSIYKEQQILPRKGQHVQMEECFITFLLTIAREKESVHYGINLVLRFHSLRVNPQSWDLLTQLHYTYRELLCFMNNQISFEMNFKKSFQINTLVGKIHLEMKIKKIKKNKLICRTLISQPNWWLSPVTPHLPRQQALHLQVGTYEMNKGALANHLF